MNNLSISHVIEWISAVTKQSGPVSLQVMIALRYFASGSYMNVIGDAHGVSKMSVSRSIHSIAKKHCQNIGLYIQYPSGLFVT
jgi:hypothetical protein